MKKYGLIVLCVAAVLKLFPQDSIVINAKYKADSMWQAMQKEAEEQAMGERATILKKLATAPSDSVFQLRIQNLYFDEFPDVSRFTNITVIEAENNLFKYIKKSAFFSDSLKKVNLSANKLKKIRFPKNTPIKTLVLNQNNFRRMPRSIRKLKQLQYLEINNNQIKHIPRFLKKNKKLILLDMNYNQVRFNKKSVKNLSNINTLLLGANGLTSVPENIGELKKLRKLNLGKNHLSELPASFKELDSLTNLIFIKMILQLFLQK